MSNTVFTIDADVFRPLLAEDPEVTLRTVLAAALDGSDGPWGAIDGDAAAWRQVADSIAERLAQPGPVTLTSQDIDVAATSLSYLTSRLDDFADGDMDRFAPHARGLALALIELRAKPDLLAAMASTDFALQDIAAYSAVLLGMRWQVLDEGGTPTLVRFGGYTLALEERVLEPGEPEYIWLTSLTDGCDGQIGAVTGLPGETLHGLAAAVAEAALELYAERQPLT